MASAATLNTWMEELVLSLLPPSTEPADIHKHKESFIRRTRHHNYGRTNQFSVVERLSGIEEKLQVLNLDDVSAELYSRRMELKGYEDHWVPDVLDLFLHLSDDPVKNSRVDHLDKIRPKSQTPPPLKWEDIEAEDPIDRRDRIWRVPEYSDFSSDEDEIVTSTTTTSPASVKQSGPLAKETARTFEDDFLTEENTPPSKLESAQFWRQSGFSVPITEIQAIREVLLMLRGLPTSIFSYYDTSIRPNPRYCIQHLEVEISSRLLTRAAMIGSEIQPLRKWLENTKTLGVMQLIESSIRQNLVKFERGIAQIQTDIFSGNYGAGVLTLLQLLHRVTQECRQIKMIAGLLPHLPHGEPIIALNTLFVHIDLAYSCCDQAALDVVIPMFLSAFKLYAKPIDKWIHTGEVDRNVQPFFISENNTSRAPATLWHNWYDVSTEDERLIPTFLKRFASKIFTAGKTAAFLRHLNSTAPQASRSNGGIVEVANETFHMINDSPVPLSTTLDVVLDRHLTTILSTSTNTLRTLLEEHCGLTRLLDAFEYLYLSKNGFILENIEKRMFDQIDKCVEIWNDRFLYADTLAEAFIDVKCVDSESLNVNSTYTSSRSMESRRRSVKILTALSLSYDFSWPISNVILPESLVSYQRIALILSQIRRTRFILEKRAYFCVQNISLASDGAIQNTARALCFTLCLFVNIVYDHFTSCTIQPMSATMRAQMTGTVDEMISIHTKYIQSLEQACLTSKGIKPLRDSLISILDLCIRFADIVHSPLTAPGQPYTEFEASSFISARSHRRRRRNGHREEDSSSEDEEEEALGEGYSTFILDEDTSIAEEITKVKEAFAKHVSFLMAGLRGVARNSGEIGELMELLADSLEAVFPQKRMRLY